ncbi:uncharacterized protein BDCG_17012 [Blastomyces dermatitidis ER-3]|uniref:Uncharacterized protein n=1 Tax=Ajellomyces dermatitidis (strain ER-3 / ATCC MYA-2586) TaxID=559297 RepID=A0ABX2VVT0_AJEDR|nr:uncharacterized protein BDCG_17012 [Blastomyces dermatitidis ER-3]OAT01270.1 hypothetical protein BDCG_17012 [Blastomyces dermatitidis ER-3]
MPLRNANIQWMKQGKRGQWAGAWGRGLGRPCPVHCINVYTENSIIPPPSPPLPSPPPNYKSCIQNIVLFIYFLPSFVLHAGASLLSRTGKHLLNFIKFKASRSLFNPIHAKANFHRTSPNDFRATSENHMIKVVIILTPSTTPGCPS